MERERWKIYLKKGWNFFWNSDSAWSWILNLVVAFIVIKFILYPVLGMVLGTSYPIVAVMSESMEHGLYNGQLCGNELKDFKESFDNYWDTCGYWYVNQGISKEQFDNFWLRDGFNKGDVIILWRSENAKVGDILVFDGGKAQPIIHRIVKVNNEEGKKYYQTKGDHNANSIIMLGEYKVAEERMLGKAIIRIPYLGWVKLLFVDLVRPFGIVIEK
jgi:signal peptidase I